MSVVSSIDLEREQLQSVADARPSSVDPSTIRSLYVSNLPHDLMLNYAMVNTEDTLRDFLENKLKLGIVSRIDFVTKQVDGEQGSRLVRSAFIHFDRWFDNEAAMSFRQTLADNVAQPYKCYGYVDSHGKFRRFVSGVDKSIRRFVAFKINWKPIPEVDRSLNIHQLQAAVDGMSKVIAEKDAEIAELKAQLEKIRCPVEGEVELGVDGKGEMTLAEIAV
jgi:hypothetical protein